MNFGDLYYEEITNLAFRELVNVGSWFNRFVGHHPMLIGGWAVHHYNPAGLGSRDIDLVFRDAAIKDRLVNIYMMSSGYAREKAGDFEEQFVLHAPTSRFQERIYLDVTTTLRRNLLRGTNVEIPWNLAFDHSRTAIIGGAQFYVPSPEVLILLKAKASIDRGWRIEEEIDSSYTRNKIWKDHYDIVSIFKTCQLDLPLLSSLIEKCGFVPHFRRALGIIAENGSVLDAHNIRWGDISGKVKGLL